MGDVGRASAPKPGVKSSAGSIHDISAVRFEARHVAARFEADNADFAMGLGCRHVDAA